MNFEDDSLQNLQSGYGKSNTIRLKISAIYIVFWIGMMIWSLLLPEKIFGDEEGFTLSELLFITTLSFGLFFLPLFLIIYGEYKENEPKVPKTYKGFPVHKEHYVMNHGVKEEYIGHIPDGGSFGTEYVIYNHGIREPVLFWDDEELKNKK